MPLGGLLATSGGNEDVVDRAGQTLRAGGWIWARADACARGFRGRGLGTRAAAG